jgi:class 3 adenylate cyclase/tetratricopeptide (TPR) repeat protein
MVLCPQCNEENPPKFRLCGYCGAPLLVPGPALPEREVRRTVTIIFCDLKGSTELGESLDSEVLHEVKRRYFQGMAAEIARHGGKIEKYIGDAIMAVFGLPQLHEDDALRALRAAQGMREALKRVNVELRDRYGIELANRTGINTGEVLALDDPAAAQQLATGDAVNVAARLEQAAPPGEIYLGAVTYRLARDAIEVEAVEPLILKGKTERVAAYRLIEVHGLDGYARRADSPIVGREDELAAVEALLTELMESRSARVATILGHAGIGKSRLSREVMARAAGAGARTVQGRCLPYGDGITFWPLRDIAGGAAGIRADDSPEEARAKLGALIDDADVTARLASAIGLSTAAFPLHEINWAARKFLEKLAAGRPLVALIDDIHWAEPAFLDLLDHLLTSSEDAPILLLTTSRPELLDKRPQWGERPGCLRLELEPLSDAAAARVAENLFGASFPADVAARIVAAAEGNPLYVEQILAMLVDSKAIEKEQGGSWVRSQQYGEIEIPPTIKALLEARLGQLGLNERYAIEPASVIGLQFAVSAVAALEPEDARTGIDEQMAALTRKQFILAVPSDEPELVCRFQHHLVRDTVYGGLLKRSRAKMHVEFVRWADQVCAERGRALEFEEILGYHLEQAYRYLTELGALDERAHEIGRDASQRLASAARRSFARGDAHAADNMFRRAIAMLKDDDPTRLPLLPERAEVMLELGKFADAKMLVDQAHELATAANDLRVKAAADLVRMHVLLHKAEPGSKWSEAAMQLTTETIPLLESEQSYAALARAWRLVALTRQIAGAFVSAGEAILKVVAYARAAGDERLVARSALGLAYNALFGPTPVDEALRQCEEFVDGEQRDRQVQGLIMCRLAQLRAMNGDFENARSMYHRARSMLDDLGHSVRTAQSSIDLASIELLAGDPAAAESAMRVDYETVVRMGTTYFLSSMAAILARAVRAQGRDQEAFDLTRTAEAAAADDDVEAQVLWRCIRAPILARAGNTTEAQSLARAALERARLTQMPALQGLALVELATVLHLAGHVDGACAAVGEAIAIYAAKGDIVSTARSKDLLASMERGC